MMSLFGNRTVISAARQHGITRLLHSTHLYKNFPQILEDGTLHTVRSLIGRHGAAQAARFLHDPRRYEKFAVGLDYLNASLSFPNVELLYHRSKGEWKADWIHLALDLKLLDDPETLFCPVSAAADFGKHVVKGKDGFYSLFAETVDGHTRENLAKNIPTHPQAEVLLRGPLTLSKVLTLIVPAADVAHEVERLLARRQFSIPVEILPQLFVWPKRLMK